MSANTIYLIEAATGVAVEAELHDDLTPDVLLDVEDQWTPSRQELRTKLRYSGIPRQDWPESHWWDWGAKSLRLALAVPADFRVMAICRQTVWEAAMVTRSQNHFALLAPDIGKPLIYVDFLEVAPWNWNVETVQVRKFKTAGPALLRAAIEQSFAKGWDGHIGLHALPQAMSFYSRQGLLFIKNDRTKQNLPYYELSAAEASKRTGRR